VAGAEEKRRTTMSGRYSQHQVHNYQPPLHSSHASCFTSLRQAFAARGFQQHPKQRLLPRVGAARRRLPSQHTDRMTCHTPSYFWSRWCQRFQCITSAT
jgi:hypothetical protein